MITVSLHKSGKRTPQEILEMLRARAGRDPFDDPWLKYAEWMFENNIEATIPISGDINFLHDEDAVAFKLRFGI